MTLKQRFYRFIFSPAAVATGILLVLMLVGCSGKSGNTTSPPLDNDLSPRLSNLTFEDGHNVFGVGRLMFDPVTWEMEVRPLRGVENHLLLTSFIVNSNCPGGRCLSYRVTGYDPSIYTWYIDLYLTNPTQWDAYDMRLTFDEFPVDPDTLEPWKIQNADSYTDIWLPEVEFDASDENWVVEDVGIKPFIAFEKDQEQRIFYADPDDDGPEVYTDREELIVMIPPGAPMTEPLVILDGCWPSHCNEPYQVVKMDQAGSLPPNDLAPPIRFTAVVADWQRDIPGEGIESVSVWIPDIADEADDYWIEMEEDPDWPPGFSYPPPQDWIDFMIEYAGYDTDTLKRYFCEVGNIQSAPVGNYPAVVRAESVDIDGQDFDTMYNIHQFKVSSGGTGGEQDRDLMIMFASYESGDSADIWAYYFDTRELIQITSDFGENTDDDANSEELDVCVYRAPSGLVEIMFASNYNPVTNGTKSDFDLWTYSFNSGFPPNSPVAANSWVQFTATPDADERLPDYRSDGAWVAYCSNEFGQYEIYVKEKSGLGGGRRTMNYGSDEAPCWDKTYMPNERLYYQSNRAGGGNYEVYYIDPRSPESGSNLPVRLTFSTGFDGYPSSRTTTIDNNSLGFAWASEKLGDMDIYYWDEIIEDPVNLTMLLDQEPGDPQPMDMWPSVSTDGLWVAFSTDRKNGDMDVFRVSVIDRSLERVSRDDMDEMDPFYAGG